MGRASRKKEQNRHEKSLPKHPTFRISVFATPEGGPRLFDPEVQLAKSAVLYGDEVDLYSLSATYAAVLHQGLSAAPTSELMELALAADRSGSLDPEEVRTAMAALDQIRLRPNAPAALRKKEREIRDQLNESRRGMLRSVEAWFTRQGGEPLLEAMESGNLHVKPISEDPEAIRDPDEYIQSLFARIFEVLASKEATYPLMTGNIQSVLRAGLEEGVFTISERTRRRAQQSGLAAGLFGQLPTFPSADMTEILDIRKDLSHPLRTFRREIADLSLHLTVDAVHPDFPQEVEELWLTQVAPAIAEIDELVSGNKYLVELRKPSLLVETGATLTPAAVALGVAIATGSGIPMLAAAGIAAAAPVASHALKALAVQGERKRKLDHPQFVFLHATDARLDATG